MKNIIEAFILYVLFFFPTYVETPMSISFSIYRELFRIFIYNIPAFSLIFYLLNGKRFCSKSENLGTIFLRQGLRFFLTFSAVLLVLCLISFCVSTAASFFSPFASSPLLEKPYDAAEWLVLFISCVTTGLLEEIFFRVYLPKRFSNTPAVLVVPFLFSTALFAFSHLYEGSWGIINAFLSGFFLCLVFAKTKNLASIAMAHGFYNFLVYAMG